MRIDLLENGMDSLIKGFQSFSEFESNTINKEPSKEDYFLLKQAVLSTHHGIEILFKYVLNKKSEFLIVSKIDNNYMFCYEMKEKHNKSSVFECENSDMIHTITYLEALERIEYFLTTKLSPVLKDKLKELNRIRNILTHAEININDSQIINVFRALLNDLDIFFVKAIGDDYKSIFGYSDLKKNYDDYMKHLTDKGNIIKSQALEAFFKSIEFCEISIGENNVVYIDDISKAKKLITKLNTYKLNLGMDLVNSYCSGDVKISIEDDSHFSIWAEDNNGKYIFKFKSMILYMPNSLTDMSPIIIFESDDDSIDETLESNIIQEIDTDFNFIEGLCYYENDKETITFDLEEINRFMNNWDDEYYKETKKYYIISKYLTKSIFAFINIQGLDYWDFRGLLDYCRRKNISGKELQIRLKQKM